MCMLAVNYPLESVINFHEPISYVEWNHTSRRVISTSLIKIPGRTDSLWWTEGSLFYIATSTNRQGKPRPALLLTTACCNKSFISCNKSFISACPVKLILSIGLVQSGPSYFLTCLWTWLSASPSITTQKRSVPISSYIDFTVGQ